MEKIKNNRKDKLLLLMAVLFIVFTLIGEIFGYINYGLNLSGIGESVIFVLICLFMYLSYRAHNKNVMKPLLGAALMVMLYIELDWALFYLNYFGELHEWYEPAAAFMAYCFLEFAIAIVLLLINIIHYVINATHLSSPKKIRFNKSLLILYVVLVIGQIISCFIFYYDSAAFAISEISFCLSSLAMIYMVIVIEGSLDGFRIEREAKAIESEASNEA